MRKNPPGASSRAQRLYSSPQSYQATVSGVVSGKDNIFFFSQTVRYCRLVATEQTIRLTTAKTLDSLKLGYVLLLELSVR